MDRPSCGPSCFHEYTKNSELVAIFSDDEQKRKKLARRYGVQHALPYADYDEFLRSGEVDAVYIGLPNSMHCDFTVRAAEAGVHVLCEKPMAVTEEVCDRMIQVCRERNVKLMIAYRLHFDPANLQAIEIVRRKLGSPRFFSSVFGQTVEEGNIRLKRELGGGPLLDMGIYCLNAARYLFQAEPLEGWATVASSDDPRFREVEETLTATLRFPEEKLATFICSFGSAPVDSCEVLGTKGRLRMEPIFDVGRELKLELTIGKKTKVTKFKKHDQFGPEILYFSDCVLGNREPEPSGIEGRNDIRIIRALYESVQSRQAVRFEGLSQKTFPGPSLKLKRPAVSEPDLVKAKAPSAA